MPVLSICSMLMLFLMDFVDNEMTRKTKRIIWEKSRKTQVLECHNKYIPIKTSIQQRVSHRITHNAWKFVTLCLFGFVCTVGPATVSKLAQSCTGKNGVIHYGEATKQRYRLSHSPDFNKASQFSADRPSGTKQWHMIFPACSCIFFFLTKTVLEQR